MNRDILAGKWKQLKGSAKQKWGKLTDDDLDRVEGSRDELIGMIQERYGKSREEAEREVDDWQIRV
ncbi:MAG: CsbD family protein [Planctomycetaceae bacterium]|nr:MAG: CsbD family protein [Planctomycetaceae bacterium]